jgi:hypothetical protein
MIGHGHVRNTCPLSPQLLQNIVISTLASSKLLFRFKQMSSQSYRFDAALVTISWTSPNYSAVVNYCGSGYSNGVTTFVVKGNFFTGGTTPTNDATLVLTNTSGVLSGTTANGVSPSGSGSITVSLEYNAANFIMRDASDITRALKERIIYNEKRIGSPINSGKRGSLVPGRPGVNPGAENHIPAGNAGVAWIPYSNEYRLSYLFGKLKCGAGSGGAFNLNGPIQRS